jgi:hypothetical protein
MLWGEMDEEIYEEMIPEDDSEEENDQDKESANGNVFDINDTEPSQSEETGFKTPSEGYSIYLAFFNLRTPLFV